MKKVSLKIAGYTILSAGLALALFACTKPVDLGGFLEDPKVVDVIEGGAERVTLISGSEGAAGNKRISGLSSGKYYVVEHWTGTEGDTDTSRPSGIPNIYVVSGGGGLSSNLTDIGRIGGTTITTGLTNFHKYNVKSAISLGSRTVTDNPPPNTTSLPTGVSGSPTMVIVPITPTGTKSSVSAPTSITLNAAGSETDYVFIETSGGAVNFTNFYDFKVFVKPASLEGDLAITISFTITGNTLALTPSSQTFKHSDLKLASTITITLTSASGNGVKWYNGSTELTSPASGSGILVMDLSADAYINFLVGGATYYITVVDGGASGVFTLVINNDL